MLLATFVLLGAGACEGGGGDGTSLPSGRPSTDRTVTRPTDDTQETPKPTDDRTGRPTRTGDATPTARPTEAPPTTAQPAPTTGQPRPEPTRAQPTQAPEQPPDTAQAAPPAQQPVQPATTPPAASDVAAESTGSGDVWCLLLILMVGLLVGGLVLWRTQHRSDWDTDAATLVGATTAVLNRLPSMLTTTTAGERALTWPPLRDDLGNLMGSWDVLASRTADEERRAWAYEVRTSLQDLVDAVDQENEVLAADREWRLLRPRVIAAQEALAAVLSARPQPGTPAPSMAGRPGQPGAAGHGATPYGSSPADSPPATDYPPRHAAPPPDLSGPSGPSQRPTYPPEPPDPPGYGDGPPFTSRG
jgi:hypothetical protein